MLKTILPTIERKDEMASIESMRQDRESLLRRAQRMQ